MGLLNHSVNGASPQGSAQGMGGRCDSVWGWDIAAAIILSNIYSVFTVYINSVYTDASLIPC